MDDRYNFTFYSGDGKNLVVEGNVNEKSIPNGEFVFYSTGSEVLAQGEYRDGLITGKWEYEIESKPQFVFWKAIRNGRYDFSLPSTFKREDKSGFLIYSVSLSSDSLIDSRFVAKTHNINDLDIEDFSEFQREFFRSVESKSLSVRVDYSKEFSSSLDYQNVIVRQYLGKDSSDDSIVVFFALIESPKFEEIIELSYVVPQDRAAISFRIFSELMLSLHYDSSPVIDRWKLNY